MSAAAGPVVDRATGARVLKDVAVVLGFFFLAAVVVGALLPHLVDAVVVRRTESGLLTDEVELGDRFDIVGWYTLLSGAAGLLLGVVLVAWRRTHEVVTLLAVVAGACLAAWLSSRVATWLGPQDPNQVLAHAKVGATAEGRIVLSADAAYLVWPISALVGAVVVLWSRRDHRPAEDEQGPNSLL